jgi:acyl-CoA synthetase (AMP-forming)/AMP-acid ligase II
MQTISSIYEVNTPQIQPSLFHGPADPPLVTVALGAFLDIQCERYGEREALVFPWTGTRWTYNDLKEESSKLARYLYSRGIRPGDRIAILAGNRVEYASVFFACMRIGAVLVILNNTYTIPEAEYALKYTGQYCCSNLEITLLINLQTVRYSSQHRRSVNTSTIRPC